MDDFHSESALCSVRQSTRNSAFSIKHGLKKEVVFIVLPLIHFVAKFNGSLMIMQLILIYKLRELWVGTERRGIGHSARLACRFRLFTLRFGARAIVAGAPSVIETKLSETMTT